MKNKQVGFKENQIELLQMTNIVIKIKNSVEKENI